MPYPKQLRAEVKSIVCENVKGWRTDKVYVPFSLDFAVERLLTPLGKSLHGSDDNPLTNLTGAYYSGCRVELGLRPEAEDKLAWMGSRVNTDVERLATAFVASKLMPFIQLDESKARNAYFEKVKKAYMGQWDGLVETAKSKIENMNLKLTSYHLGSIQEWLDSTGTENGIILNALSPQDRGLAVRASRELGKIFDVPFAGVDIYTDDLLAEIVETAIQRDAWMVITQDEIEGEGIEEYLVAKVKPTNRATTTYVYARSDRKRIVTPCQKFGKSEVYEKLTEGEELTGDLSIAPISQQTFFSLRSQYMNKGIRPGKPTQSYGVFCGGKLIGAYAMDTSGSKIKWEKHVSTPAIYMMSDFPVEPVDYGKLAKLVLVAALSKESRYLMERLTRGRVKSIITSAFSKNPVSMKYRGLFRLLIRKENKILEERDWAKEADNDYYKRPYALEYGAEAGQWTLEEGLRMWMKKYGQKGGNREAEE